MHTRHAMGVLVILAAAMTALAGPLATDGNAYNDGNGPDDGAWRGTTRMESEALVVDVDFCVYGPGDYTGSYEADSNEFVYAYQAYTLGEAALSQLSPSRVTPCTAIATRPPIASCSCRATAVFFQAGLRSRPAAIASPMRTDTETSTSAVTPAARLASHQV